MSWRVAGEAIKHAEHGSKAMAPIVNPHHVQSSSDDAREEPQDRYANGSVVADRVELGFPPPTDPKETKEPEQYAGNPDAARLRVKLRIEVTNEIRRQYRGVGEQQDQAHVTRCPQSVFQVAPQGECAREIECRVDKPTVKQGRREWAP